MLGHIPFYGSLLGKVLYTISSGKSKGSVVHSTNSHVLVYGAIEAHSFGPKGCIASNRQIAQETGLTESSVSCIISVLAKAGWVEVTPADPRKREKIVPMLELTVKPKAQQPAEPLMPINVTLNEHQAEPLMPINHRIHSKNTVENTYISSPDNFSVDTGAAVTRPQKETATTVAEEDKRLARLLMELVATRYPFTFQGKSTKNISKKLRLSAEAINRLHRLDGCDYRAIENVLRWSQQDTFWQANIRSGASLRKHFEDLQVKSQNYFATVIKSAEIIDDDAELRTIRERMRQHAAA